MDVVGGEDLRNLITEIRTKNINEKQMLRLLVEQEVVLKDYFRLKCGYYSRHFVDYEGLSEDPKTRDLLVKELSERFKEYNVNLIVCPNSAILNYVWHIAEALKARKILAELDDNLNVECFKNDFDIRPNDRAIVIDGIMTSGRNMWGMCKLVDKYGARVEGIGLITSRYDRKVFGELKLPTDNIEVLVQFNFDHFKNNPWPDKVVQDYREFLLS